MTVSADPYVIRATARNGSAAPRTFTRATDSLVAPVLMGAFLSAVLIGGIMLDIRSALMLAALLTLVVAMVSPATGLATLLIVSPLLVVPLLPAPGFAFFLVAASLFGCLCRLPIDRPVLM